MKNSFIYIHIICNALFSNEYKRLQRNVESLHKDNQEILHLRLDGFMYQGKFYKPAATPNGKGQRKTLALPLWDQMEEHLQDERTVMLDNDLVRQTLFQLMEPCGTLQEVRDAIPDCINDTLPDEVRMLARMADPAWTIQNNPRHLRQYERTLPKFEFYSAARLIY